MPNHAPAPSRATSQFTVMLGMVPVPLRLFTPTGATQAVERHWYNPVTNDKGETTFNPVGMPLTDKVTGEKVDRAALVKMVEMADGELIELSDDEMSEVTSGHAIDKGAVTIETFIPLDSLDDRYKVESWYQARPQMRQNGKKRVDDPVANKAFGLLMETMRIEGVAALVRVGMRQNARYAALTPDGVLMFLHFDHEVRADRDMPDTQLSEGEIVMARQLVKDIGVGTPDLEDKAGEAIWQYLEHKASGDVDFTPSVAPDPPETMLDLTALLAASVNKG